MAFTDTQKKQLAQKLNRKHVRSRAIGNLSLSYIEGWHAIFEANRIFGFEGWDRETIDMSCIWQGNKGGEFACAYTTKVRITVRAGEGCVRREGSGAGLAMASEPGEAHERAMKEAETDATKRALSTFGNTFGLALYDKQQKGVTKVGAKSRAPSKLPVRDAQGCGLGVFDDPKNFCAKLREIIESSGSHENLIAAWKQNEETVIKLRRDLPNLLTEKGRHYSEILSALYTKRLLEFSEQKSEDVYTKSNGSKEGALDPGFKSISIKTETSCLSENSRVLTLEKGPQRIRDEQHLKTIRGQPCLLCGRTPSQAHHLTYAQPKALGRKAGDQWAVPLCLIHHRALHDFGNERRWWQEIGGVDPVRWIKSFAGEHSLS